MDYMMGGITTEGDFVKKLMTKQGSKELQRTLDRSNPAFVDQLIKEI
jgi:Mg/Co/Ni transporter MgtE